MTVRELVCPNHSPARVRLTLVMRPPIASHIAGPGRPSSRCAAAVYQPFNLSHGCGLLGRLEKHKGAATVTRIMICGSYPTSSRRGSVLVLLSPETQLQPFHMEQSLASASLCDNSAIIQQVVIYTGNRQLAVVRVYREILATTSSNG